MGFLLGIIVGFFLTLILVYAHGVSNNKRKVKNSTDFVDGMILGYMAGESEMDVYDE